MQLAPLRNRPRQALSLGNAVNRMFDEPFFGPWDLFGDMSMTPFTSTSSRYIPSFDISEDDKQIKVVADVPGYDPNDIKVTLEDGVLTIRGEMKEEKEEKDKKWHRKECSCGSFYRQVSLPSSADKEKIKCKAKNGKLKITIQKKPEAKLDSKSLIIDVE